MASISVPELLKIPEKLFQLLVNLNNYRYFLAKGGRGGAKSQSIARIVLYLGEKRKLRVVCGRETQNTIQESVYSLMVDLIRQYQLNYEIQANKLTHRETGTDITFRGFRQQGAFNIQGMEGIDIVWIDESQALTKQTIDVLIPTIRKNNAKIFFSMNPHVFDDPVVVFLSNREDSLTVDINYNENPYCTDALKREAEECLKKDKDDYEHIWLGKPLAMSEDAVFNMEELQECSINRHQPSEHYGLRVAGFDIARYGDDKCAAVIIQQMGALHWEVIHVDEWGHKDLNFTTGRILEIHKDYQVEQSIIDEDGLGAGPLDSLNVGRQLTCFTGFKNPNIAYKDNREYANPRTINAYKAKDMFRKHHLAITHIPLMKELCTIKYTYDHQQRKVLVSKDKMRKEGIKSPNLADALIMAVSLIGDVKAKQDNQYAVRKPQYCPEENIFGLAGIR